MDELILSADNVLQPDIYRPEDRELHVAITSLSIGGAERIVLDWAARVHPHRKVHLILMRDRDEEWPVPSFVRVTRLHNTDVIAKLRALGAEIAQSGNPTCLCHLFTAAWRKALSDGGAEAIPVLHNAKEGWPEGIEFLAGAPYVIAVSDACEKDLRRNGWEGPISVVRHLPFRREHQADAREKYREAWNVPSDAIVIGMIGAVKSQKNYGLALRVLRKLHETLDAYLVILGGPVNTKEGPRLWHALVDEVHRLGLRSRVAMPGFMPFASTALPAFDVMLNTSHFEGLSIATLEALANDTPVVASKVGGQGEIGSDGLTLISPDADEGVWVEALKGHIGKKFPTPDWASFPAYRLWTLASLARSYEPLAKTLFLTSNLNSGGAQRSLVNLAKGLENKHNFEIALAGNSTSAHFYRELRGAGVSVCRLAETWSAFAYAEALVEKICAERIGTVCFWNVHPQVRLLLVKVLGFTKVRFVEVSPGGYAFEEMENAKRFEHLVGFSAASYYRRLDRLVLKYHGTPGPYCAEKTVVIPNGVPSTRSQKKTYRIGRSPRIVVSGRIAPSKFTAEIVEAMRMVRERFADAQVHFFGASEPTDAAYARNVYAMSAQEIGRTVFFHGADFEMREKLHQFDAYVVLGRHQGCPNALLEALSAGLPSIGNDDGGTREQLVHEHTGLLVSSCDPSELAHALCRLLTDEELRERLGRAGREHVERHFTMEDMVSRYRALLLPGSERVIARKTAVAPDTEDLNYGAALAGM